MKNTVFALIALAFAASCGSPVGQTCKANSDCTDGYGCFTQFSGGFCSQPCDTEGSITTCPSKTACAPITANTLACSPLCAEDAECPTGLKCGAVNNQTSKVCRN